MLFKRLTKININMIFIITHHNPRDIKHINSMGDQRIIMDKII